jgi:glutamate racemase
MKLPDAAMRVPKILVFDSGLGGLTVLAAIKTARPDARLIYVADDAAFPYGNLSEAGLVARVTLVMARLVARFSPDLVVIACNTASTLVLPVLRERFRLPFVGTVPAIKPAAEQSRSRMISVLATPGTVARDYTRALAETFAFHCDVTLVGALHLAAFAEAEMRGEPAPDAGIAAEIEPCFVARRDARTDCIVLACTHYPLLLKRFEALAPWPVTWIDPAPAIARRADHVLNETGLAMNRTQARPLEDHIIAFTSGMQPTGTLALALSIRGLRPEMFEPFPLNP